MDSLQNSTKPVDKTDNNVEDIRWQTWIDYRALNGTIIDWDETEQSEKIRKMNVQELADKLAVHRDTLYKWEKIIPDFWAKVRARKQELASERRLSLMEDKFYIHAMTWKDWRLSALWMQQNSPNWKDPKVKVEQSVDEDTADLIRMIHQNKKPVQAPQLPVIEATVTHEPDQPKTNA